MRKMEHPIPPPPGGQPGKYSVPSSNCGNRGCPAPKALTVKDDRPQPMDAPGMPEPEAEFPDESGKIMAFDGGGAGDQMSQAGCK